MPADTPPDNAGDTGQNNAQASDRRLGQDRDVIEFEGAAEARDIIVSMVAQGGRQAQIFSRDLEPLLYNNRAFEDGLLHLLRSNPSSHCQLLVQNDEDLFRTDHRLLAVNQQLSSYMQMRLVPKEARDVMQNFILIDNSGYLKRPNSAVYQGIANFNDPATVRDLSHAFKQWWEQSSPLVGSRRLNI